MREIGRPSLGADRVAPSERANRVLAGRDVRCAAKRVTSHVGHLELPNDMRSICGLALAKDDTALRGVAVLLADWTPSVRA